jgi:hypothetical protein
MKKYVLIPNGHWIGGYVILRLGPDVVAKKNPALP